MKTRPPAKAFSPGSANHGNPKPSAPGKKNARVVLLRTSVVLGPHGGAMQPIYPVFRAGLGGNLGSGRQWMAWIHLDDEAALTLHALEHETIEGPLEAVAPQPCRNTEFTSALARTVHRPAFFHVPAFVLKTALGDFSHELLDSKRIISRRIPASGFTYRFPTLDSALADIAASWSRPRSSSSRAPWAYTPGATRSGVCTTVDSQVRARDVGGFRSGDERYHRGDVIDMPVALQRRAGNLRLRPFAGSGIELRIGGTGLNIVDGDCPASQPLAPVPARTSLPPPW